MNSPANAPPKQPSWMKTLLDLGPLVLFFLTNLRFGLLYATAVLMVATAVSLCVGYIRERRLAMMPLITCIGVLIFGGLTLALQDEVYIKIKATIVYVVIAGILLTGLALGRAFVRNILQSAFQLPDRIWRVLTYRFAGFFLFLAVLNEIVWRTVPTDTWVAIKVWGFFGLTFLFITFQVPLILKHEIKPEGSPESAAAE